MAEHFVPPQLAEVTTPRFFTYYTENGARSLLAGTGLEILDAEVAPDPRSGQPQWVSVLARKPTGA